MNTIDRNLIKLQNLTMLVEIRRGKKRNWALMLTGGILCGLYVYSFIDIGLYDLWYCT